MTLVLRYAARSDRGLVRSNNEDSVYAGARLLALADGMGGHAAGEVASQLVIAGIAHLDDDEPGGDLLSKLDDAVHQGNAAIAEHVEAEPELDGMGTTLTAILFAGNRLGLVHIGDSRGYLLRDGELTQITKDDTFVQTLVDEGRITAEEAHSHPQRSLIMRALTGHEVEPTLIMREARVGDRYLLCSDGLSDPVSQETIHEALQLPDVTAAADRLIELALRGGGPDNVTVVVADVVDDDFAGQTQPILAGAVSGIDEASAPPNTAAGRASAINQRLPPAPRPEPQPEPSPPRKPRGRRRLTIAAILIVLLVLAAIATTGIIRSNYYVASHQDTVSIMRGVPGSILGISLQSPHFQGCLNDRGELSQISYGDDAPGCRLMRVQDLRPSERNQVSQGLPTGTLDDAIRQLHQLADTSLLPLCPVPAPRKQAPKPPAPGPATSATAPTTSASPTDSATPTTSAPPAPAITTAPPAPGDRPDTAADDTELPEAPSATPVPHGPKVTTPAPAPTTAAPVPGTDCREAA